jgi:hypothetical protein
MLASRSPLRCSTAWLLRRQRLHTPAAQDDGQEIRYLVVDGYVKTGRDVLMAGGATTAGQLYANMLVKATQRCVGHSATYDLVYPADPDFVAPDLSKVRAKLLPLLLDAAVVNDVGVTMAVPWRWLVRVVLGRVRQ